MQTQAVIEHITQWLKSYAEGARQGFAVGVSGGIDRRWCRPGRPHRP